MSQLAALEGTPLGKLLQAAPDVKVGGQVIPWNSLGLSLLATWKEEKAASGFGQLADTCRAVDTGRREEVPHLQGGAERRGPLNGVSGNGVSGYGVSGIGVSGNAASGNGVSGNGVFPNGALGNEVSTSNGVVRGEAFGNRIFSNGVSLNGFSQNGFYPNVCFQQLIPAHGVSGISGTSGNRVSGGGIPGVSGNGNFGSGVVRYGVFGNNDVSGNRTVGNGVSGNSGTGVEGSSSCSSTSESSGNQKFQESCPGKNKSSEGDEEVEEEEEGLLTLSLGPVSTKEKKKKEEKCFKRGSNAVSEKIMSIGGGKEESTLLKTVTETDMENLYGMSYRPVLVSDEENLFLWSNLAFRKVASEVEKKSNSAVQVHSWSGGSEGGGGGGDRGDLLKSLVPVERLLFCSYIGPPQKAVMWEFLPITNLESKLEAKTEIKSQLKTEAVEGGISTHGTSFSAYERSPVKGAVDRGRESSTISGDCFVYSSEVAQKVRTESSGHLPGSGVICPQPVRSVGSRITVKNFRSVPGFASPMVGTFESVQCQFDDLERWSAPVVTTDKLGRVCWVNTAYKLLTRQPKCSWMASTFGRKDEVSSALLVGEVALTGLEDLPRTVVTVLCAAEISCFSSANGKENGSKNGKQNGAEKLVVQMPALVTRLDSPEGSILGYVFHFDTTSVGLRLMDGA